MKYLGKSVALVVVLLLSATCLAQVEVIREKKHGKVISVEAQGALLGKHALPAAKSVDGVAEAMGQLKQHGAHFGVSDAKQELRVKQVVGDALGMTHVHFAQFYKGVPVLGGALIVHLNSDGTLRSINGDFVTGINLETTPSLTEDGATAAVRQYWSDRHGDVAAEVAAPALWVLDRAVLDDGSNGGARLVWKVEARNLEKGLQEEFYIDAQTGELAWWMNAVRGATRREVFDSRNPALGCVMDYYDSTYNYTFGRSEGQPARGPDPITGRTTADLLYDRLEIVRRYYLDTFNRNGANGQGGLGDGSQVPTTTAQVRVVSDSGGMNFRWFFRVNEQSPLIDLLGHEYSHSVTVSGGDYLVYAGESGSLDEAFSDLQGEGFEQYLTGAVDWLGGGRSRGGQSTISIIHQQSIHYYLTVTTLPILSASIRPISGLSIPTSWWCSRLCT